MAYTTAFNFSKPAYRTIRYDEEMNNNADRLEAALLGFPGANPPGHSTNWPDVTPSNGMRWVDTVNHQEKVYYSGDWQIINQLDANAKFTPEGGLAVKLTNKTGSNSVKGYCITSDSSNNEPFILVPIDAPSCMGIVYEDGIADGSLVWCVVSGIAEVYFWGSTTRGHLARTGLSVDTGEVAGQAMSEAYPTTPFATDKHFCEVGHVLETRSGAGLAKTVLHFN